MTVPRHSERGGMLVYIFIMAAIFVALSYAVSESFKVNEGTGKAVNEEKMRLTFNEINDVIEAHRIAIKTMLLNGVNIDEIEAYADGYYPYTNADCTSDTCRLYAAGGGGLQWYKFTILHPDLTDVPGVTAAFPEWPNGLFWKPIAYQGSPMPDLIYSIRITRDFCNFINRQLGITVDADSYGTHGAVTFQLNAGGRIGHGPTPHNAAIFSDPADPLHGKNQGCHRWNNGAVDSYRYFSILHKT